MAFSLKLYYSKIYRTYDLVNRLFTMGMDQKWRKYTVGRCLEQKPKSVLDLCCGTGDLAIKLAQNSTEKTEISAYDFNPQMLEMAKNKSGKLGVKVNYLEGDASNMPFKDESFDRVTIGFGFRNLTFENPSENTHIKEIYRIMKPNGKLLILESGVPGNSLVRFFYKLYLYVILVPLGTIISGNAKAYWYLAHSASKFYKVNELIELLKRKGFKSVEVKRFFLGAANLFEVSK